MQKKKILFIIPYFPYPMKTGGHVALFYSIMSVKDDFDVFVVYEAIDDDEYRRYEKEFLNIIPEAHLFPCFIQFNKTPEYPSWYRFISGIKESIGKAIRKEKNTVQIEEAKMQDMCSVWLKTSYPLGKRWLEHILKLCADYYFDIIQVEMLCIVSQILTLPKASRKIFVHHELGFVRRELEQSKFECNQYSKACKGFSDMAEIGLLNMYDAIITLSPIDKEKLMQKGVTVPIHSSFASINIPKNHVSSVGNGKHLSFVGPDSHAPNLIGLTWFLNNCWKTIRATDENYRLSIIGEWSPTHIREFTSKYPNVEFLGFVDNLENAIKGSIMIVPITIGSGIRMKILEACSYGVPFVSTTIGAEGIPLENGKHCFIADSQEMFAKKIIELQDLSIQKKFVENSHALVVNYYSQEALKKNRLNIYEQVLAG